MFESKEEALQHRDQVLDALVDAFDPDSLTDSPYLIHPVLDGAVVRVDPDDVDLARSALEDGGFTVSEIGESGDWFELKAKP